MQALSGSAGANSQKAVPIETIEDYERATQRIAVLDASARREVEERERQALLEAVSRWDRRHDDATRWKDQP